MPTKTRAPLIIGNWKMYKTFPEAKSFIESLNNSKTAYLAVPYTLIQPLSALNKPNVVIGAQNMNDASEGAFTGEISGRMLKDAGAKFVVLGHSERRQFFKEDNLFIQKKVKRALSDGLDVILCVGETLEQHENHKTEEVLEKQLTESLGDLKEGDFDHLSIAYEPVWAIGTGLAATAEEAEKEHSFIRSLIDKRWGKGASSKVKILYGGSVKPENAEYFLKQADIDGLLIGGASLNVDSFGTILSLT